MHTAKAVRSQVRGKGMSMTVIVMTTKTIGAQIKGDIFKFEHVRKIVEEEKKVRLIRNENWETIINKEHNKIIAVEYAE